MGSARRLLLLLLLFLPFATSAPSPSPSAAPSAAAPSTSAAASVAYLPLSVHCRKSERIPNVMTTIFLSNSPSFFGCLVSPDRSGFFLAVTGSSLPGTPLWVANPTHPAKDNSTLLLDPSTASFSFLDPNSSLLWRFSHTSLSAAAGLSLGSDGNLVVFDAGGATLWQSFDYPVDLIVPGQELVPGSVLIAGFSSHIAPVASFYAAMEPGGLVLYENSTSRPLPYFAFAYPWTSTTLPALSRSACNHTRLTLTPLNLTQIQDLPVCASAASAAAAAVVSFGAPVSFVRLDPDGFLRAYYPDHRLSYDLLKNQSKGICGVPNFCGPYGICSDANSSSAAAPSCRCPSGAGFPNASSSDCSPTVSLDCRQTSLHHFLEISGVDYFANDHIAATSLSDNTFAACQQACAASCACRAAFYRNATKECYLHESVMSMIGTDESTYRAALKLQAAGEGDGMNAGSSSRSSEVKLIVGITVAAAISVGVLAAWIYVKGRKGMLGFGGGGEEDLDLLSLPGQPRRFTFKELQAATWEFSQKLGGGGFGSVYKGLFPDGTSVAVKQLEKATTASLKEFRNEVNTLSNVNHHNLVHLRGFCAEGPHRLLVYEYVPNGSLDAWLFTKGDARPGPYLDWPRRLAIAQQTAQGLYFLHGQCRNSIIHLDIKPQNILLDKEFVPKISDFGLSRLVNEDNNTAFTRMRGTPGYMAPECLIITDASEKSDVYSFGMVLLEIVSGRKNVDLTRLVLHGDEERWYFPAYAAQKLKGGGDVGELVDENLKMGVSEMAEAKRVVYIAFWCIQDQPAIRPTMHKVLLMLQGHSEVRVPPLSFTFGMRFQINSAIPSAPHTPKNHPSAPISAAASPFHPPAATASDRSPPASARRSSPVRHSFSAASARSASPIHPSAASAADFHNRSVASAPNPSSPLSSPRLPPPPVSPRRSSPRSPPPPPQDRRLQSPAPPKIPSSAPSSPPPPPLTITSSSSTPPSPISTPARRYPLSATPKSSDSSSSSNSNINRRRRASANDGEPLLSSGLQSPPSYVSPLQVFD